MSYIATKQHVANRGVPPNDFLDQLVAWGKQAPDEIFAPNTHSDVHSSVFNTLGPWQSIPHRRVGGSGAGEAQRSTGEGFSMVKGLVVSLS
jgi:hypothetical protein